MSGVSDPGALCNPYSNHYVLHGRGSVLWHYVQRVAVINTDVRPSISLSTDMDGSIEDDICRRQRVHGSSRANAAVPRLLDDRGDATEGVPGVARASQRPRVLRGVHGYHLHTNLHLDRSTGIPGHNNILIYHLLEAVFQTREHQVGYVH